METVLEKAELTPNTFKQKRFDLFEAQKWNEYQDLLTWEYD